MPGEEHQRHVGALGVLTEIVERPAHAAKVAVRLEEHVEAELLQRLFERSRIVDRIVELADGAVVVVAHDQRHAPFGRRNAGKDDERDDGENAQHLRPKPISRVEISMPMRQPQDRAMEALRPMRRRSHGRLDAGALDSAVPRS